MAEVDQTDIFAHSEEIIVRQRQSMTAGAKEVVARHLAMGVPIGSVVQKAYIASGIEYREAL